MLPSRDSGEPSASAKRLPRIGEVFAFVGAALTAYAALVGKDGPVHITVVIVQTNVIVAPAPSDAPSLKANDLPFAPVVKREAVEVADTVPLPIQRNSAAPELGQAVAQPASPSKIERQKQDVIATPTAAPVAAIPAVVERVESATDETGAEAGPVEGLVEGGTELAQLVPDLGDGIGREIEETDIPIIREAGTVVRFASQVAGGVIDLPRQLLFGKKKK